MSITDDQPLSSMSSAAPVEVMPALLITTVTGPNRASAAANAAVTLPASVTSSGTACALPPGSRVTVSASAPSRRAATVTAAPAAASTPAK